MECTYSGAVCELTMSMRHADKLILVVGPDQTSCSLGGNVNQLSVPTLM